MLPKTADELKSGVTYPNQPDQFHVDMVEDGSGAGGAGDGGGDPPLQAKKPHDRADR